MSPRSRHRRAVADHADTRWRSHGGWGGNRIRSSARHDLIGVGIGAGVFGVGTVVVLWQVIPRLLAAELGGPNLLAVLVPLVFVGFATVFGLRLGAWRRVGPLPLNLDPFPGSVAGHIGGTFWIDTSVPEGRRSKCPSSASMSTARARATAAGAPWTASGTTPSRACS